MAGDWYRASHRFVIALAPGGTFDLRGGSFWCGSVQRAGAEAGKIMQFRPDDEERIRQRAYALWEEQGCPDGCAEVHWHAAEAELAGTVAEAGTRSKEDVSTTKRRTRK